MKTMQVKLSAGDLTAYYYSESKEKRPGIVFLPDMMGLGDTIHESARLLSKEGYHVLLPDLFSHMGAIPYCMRQFMNEACRENHSEGNDALAEVHSIIDHLKTLPEVNADRIGIIGQCLSGGFVLHTAIRPDVKAPVVFHHSFGRSESGMPDTDAKKVCQQVQGHYARIDPIIPRERVELLKKQLGDKFHYHEYNLLPHGIPHFFRRTEQGARAWHNMLTFFRWQLDADDVSQTA